jgi:PKD repeat protein
LGESVQATVNGDGSYAISIGAQAGDDIVILIKDPVGNTTASRILQVAGTAPALGLTVVSPTDGSTVNESYVGVSGTFQGPANVGITFNGNSAHIIDSTFCAGNVSLETGSNQLDVVATTVDGASITQTLTVNNTGSSLVELEADAEAGYAPHTATFSLSDNTDVTVVRIEYDVDGDGVMDYTTSDPHATFQHTYISPGCYTATVTVTDSMSGIYISSRTIAVTQSDRQITRLHSVYYQLLDDLRRGDIPSAVQAFTVTSQERFESLFTAMQPTLASLADSLGTVTRTQIGSDIGEIIVKREKNGMPYVYTVNFIRSESGLWRIEDM